MNLKTVSLLVFTLAIAGCTSAGTRVADSDAGDGGVVDVVIRDSKTHEATSSDADPDEVICRRQHQVGSNFPRNVCKTRRQMEAERRSAEDAMRMNQQRVQQGSLSGNRGGG